MYNKYFICLPIALLLLNSCQSTTTSTETTTEKKAYCLTDELKKTLTFEKVVSKPIQETLSLTGNIQYDIDQTTPFVSLLDGVVTATYFSLGDYVKKGQVLAEIKSSALNEMQDENRSVQSQIKVAQRHLASVQSMFKGYSLSERFARGRIRTRYVAIKNAE